MTKSKKQKSFAESLMRGEVSYIVLLLLFCSIIAFSPTLMPSNPSLIDMIKLREVNLFGVCCLSVFSVLLPTRFSLCNCSHLQEHLGV